MFTRWIKMGIAGVVGVFLIGGLLFGRDVLSYMKTSAGSVRSAVKDAVPIEFELRRANDMIEEIVPELHANIRLIAQEEVELAAVQADIRQSRRTLAEEKKRVERLAGTMATSQPAYQLGDQSYTRRQLAEELARRFDLYREAETALQSKIRLAAAREKSLAAAMQTLERTRGQKTQLETQVKILESQYQTIKATAVGSNLQLDNTKLARTEKLIGEIKKRLDVAERVLAHEAKFASPMGADVVDEKELLLQVRTHLAAPESTVPADR
jgi:conjugal transfer/entry exclusion protein